MKKQTILILFTITICQSLKAQNIVLGLETRQQTNFTGHVVNPVSGNFLYPHQIKKPINFLFTRADTPLKQPADTNGRQFKNRLLDQENENTSWFGAGSGYGTLGYPTFSGNFNFGFSKKFAFSMAVQWDESKNNTGMGVGGILFGRVYKRKHFLISTSSGISYVDQNTPKANPTNSENYDDKYSDKYSVGVPILLQSYYVPVPSLGIGLNGFLNLNTFKPTAGFSINVVIFTIPSFSDSKASKISQHDI